MEEELAMWKQRGARVLGLVLCLTVLAVAIVVFVYVAAVYGLDVPSWLAWGIFAVLVLAQTAYMLKVRAFAKVQQSESDATSVRRVARGLLVLISGTLLMGLTIGFVEDAETILSLIGASWLLLLLGCFVMKSGFKRLRRSETLSPLAQKGAENLRYAAVMNIRLLIAPVVMLIGQAIIALNTFIEVKGHVESARDSFTTLDADSLQKPLDAIDAAFKALQSGFSTLLIFTLVVLLVMAVWFAIAQLKSLMGWHRIKNGADATADSAFAQWTTDHRWALRIAALVLLGLLTWQLLLPKPGSGQHKDGAQTTEMVATDSTNTVQRR